MTGFCLSFEPYHPYSPWLHDSWRLWNHPKSSKKRAGKGKESGGIKKDCYFLWFLYRLLWRQSLPEKNIWARRNFFFINPDIDCPRLIGREGTASLITTDSWMQSWHHFIGVSYLIIIFSFSFHTSLLAIEFTWYFSDFSTFFVYLFYCMLIKQANITFHTHHKTMGVVRSRLLMEVRTRITLVSYLGNPAPT